MSFILENELFMDFKTFIQDQKVAGTAIGFLLAQTTLDLARVGVNQGVMPLVTAIRTGSLPKYDLSQIFEALVVFLITMMVIFSTVKIFDLQTAQVPLVATVSGARL